MTRGGGRARRSQMWLVEGQLPFIAAGTGRRSGQLRRGALARVIRPIGIPSLMKRLVAPVRQGDGGLVCACLSRSRGRGARGGSSARSCSEAADRGSGQLLLGGGGGQPDLLDTVRVGAEGIAHAVAEGASSSPSEDHLSPHRGCARSLVGRTRVRPASVTARRPWVANRKQWKARRSSGRTPLADSIALLRLWASSLGWSPG